MGHRYENDEAARKESGFADSTYKTIFERLEREGADVRLALILCCLDLEAFSILIPKSTLWRTWSGRH